MSWDKPPDGYSLCFARECVHCGGHGIIGSRYCAADDMSGSTYGNISTRAEDVVRVACPHCIRGFQFVSVDRQKALQHLLVDALKDDDPAANRGSINPSYPRKDIRQALLDVVIKATEERMVKDA